MFVIYVGDPFDGATLYGPFKEIESAIEYVHGESIKEEFQIVEIKNPYKKKEKK